jgi:hypothetical protein
VFSYPFVFQKGPSAVKPVALLSSALQGKKKLLFERLFSLLLAKIYDEITEKGGSIARSSMH